MSLETAVQSLIAGVVTRSYPDFAPTGTQTPYATWQQIGGSAQSYMDNTVPSNRAARIQVNIWSESRAEANSLALQVEAAMIASSAIQARPYGAFAAIADEERNLRGTTQDFSVWAGR